jgi:hypothetical protein
MHGAQEESVDMDRLQADLEEQVAMLGECLEDRCRQLEESQAQLVGLTTQFQVLTSLCSLMSILLRTKRNELEHCPTVNNRPPPSPGDHESV